MKNLLLSINTQKAFQSLMAGLTVFMLVLAVYSFANGSLFKRGADVVVADTGDDQGQDNGQSCCDNNSGSNDYNNDQNSDNGSNQNDSQDNPNNTASNPTPTPAPAATPAPSVALALADNYCAPAEGNKTFVIFNFSSNAQGIQYFHLDKNGTYVGSVTPGYPYLKIGLGAGENANFTARVQTASGTFGGSNTVNVTGATCAPVSTPTPHPTSTPTPTPTPTPAPSKTPHPTSTPTPAPSKTPHPTSTPTPSLNCGVGEITKMINSVLQCVAQEQNQEQEQEQNNDQNQNVNQEVTATGGDSSSSSSSSSNVDVTINNNLTSTNTTNNIREFIREVPYTGPASTNPQVVMQTKGGVKELPKTGLPLAALALGGLLPAGFGFKKFGKKDQVQETANSIWTERQLNS